MARDRSNGEDYISPVRRLLVWALVLCLIVVFAVWRIDSPRVERLRAEVTDRVVPSFDWAMAPVTGVVNLFRDLQSYQRIVEQNQDLRRELQQMKAWREAALQLEQENAALRDLNNVAVDPRLTWVTGVVSADSGSPFRQSVVLNIGSRDGVQDGWAAMDGIGLVGRIAGLGRDSARVILLTDTSSRLPINIQPDGQRAILVGDNSALPVIEFLEDDARVRPGDRVVSSGDGGVFPADLLVGQVAEGADGRLRVRLAADLTRLEFLRVLRDGTIAQIPDGGELIAPPGPALVDEGDITGQAAPAASEEGVEGLADG